MKYLYQFVGGKHNGIFTKEQIIKKANGRSHDYSHLRALGMCVPRAELDNQPTFNGYYGPMFDGERVMGVDGKYHYTFDGIEIQPDADKACVIRYETQEVYDMLSR